MTAATADPALITGSAMITSLGDEQETFTALLEGRSGVGDLLHVDTRRLGLAHGYRVREADDGADGAAERPGRASEWLARVIADAVADAGLDTARRRVAVVVGTGLRELRSLELWHRGEAALTAPQLHFDAVVRSVLPAATEVLTLSNACSASAFALAIGVDLLALEEADAVVVAGCDGLTESMMAIIGRVGLEPPMRVEPFDAHRRGVLIGEGAAAVVIEPAGSGRAGGPGGRLPARVLGVGLSCDAFHETAPDQAGIVAAVRDAHARAGLGAADVGLVLAHGTGTALNDPTEAAALTEVFGPHGPPVTAIKGGTGHTSGSAALMSLLVAIRALRAGTVPATVGLRQPIAEAADLRLVRGAAGVTDASVAQINAFGFGGVNAVSLVEV